MAAHTHDDSRLTVGCPACIEGARRIGRVATDPSLSADQKRTVKNAAMLANGIHPCTGLPLDGTPGHTCGNCVHHMERRRNKTYHKCDLNYSRGAATDVRVSWPACKRHELSGTDD